MKTKKHPRDLTEAESAAIVAAFDDTPDRKYAVTNSATRAKLRAAAAARREAEAGSRPPP